MLSEIVSDFIEKENTLITAPTGHGCTTVALYMLNLLLLKKDKRIIFYNPTADIDINFIPKNIRYNLNDVFFCQSTINNFIKFLEYIDFDFDLIVIDPGDSLLINKKIFTLLNSIFKGKILATSQLRCNISNGGSMYSTLEKLNIFRYSIWIRNVSEASSLFKTRYLDIYDWKRKGNNYIRRYLVKFDTKTGVLIEI